MNKPAEMAIASGAPEETHRIGAWLGRRIEPGAVLLLNGALGSGKTVFTQGLAQGLGILKTEDILSPTFALIQEHLGPKPLCHADLYRLSGEEVRGIGLEEYLVPDSGWVVVVEWAEKGAGFLPEEGTLRIQFDLVSEKERRICFSGGAPWKKILGQLRKEF